MADRVAPELMAAALEDLPAATAVLDARGAIVIANAAWRSLGIPGAGAHQREACAALFGETDLDARIAEVLAGKRAELERAGGKAGASRITLTARPLKSGRTRGALVTLMPAVPSLRPSTTTQADDAYRVVARSIPDLVIRVRRDGSLVEDQELTATAQLKATPSMIETIAAQSAMYVERALQTGALKTGLCRLAVRGHVRDFETRVIPCGGDEALIIARDISDQTRTEEELQLFLGIALTTGDAVDLRSSLEVVMRLVCESTGWVLGQAWVPRQGGLQCAASWSTHSATELAAFRAESAASAIEPSRAASLPGSVFASGRATWIRDVTADAPFDRVDAARAAGLKTGFAVPVLADTEVVAVLEFFAFEPRDEDERLLTMVSAVAEQLGALMKRKRAEEALRLLETAVRQMTESIVIMSALPGGPVIELVSPAFSRMTGYAPEDVIGKPLDVLAGPRTDRALLADVPSRMGDGATIAVESIAYRRDGTEIPLEWTLAPVRDPAGTITHYVATQRDITQRKQAEQARTELQRVLETAARQWRMTFDAIESPILLLDVQGRLLRMNRAAQVLSGSTYKERLSKTLDAFTEGEPWKQAAEVVSRALHTRHAVSSQVRDESRGMTWDFAATLLEESDDERVILVVRDISRIVDLQESLRRSETMSVMGALVAGVAHEVRNPLHAITVTLDAFEARFKIAAEHSRHIDVLRGEVARLSALMRDLLEYGKPVTPQFFEGSIREVVQQAMTVSASHAAEAGVTIACEIPSGLPPTKVDKARLAQVFQNLLDNAIQHSKHGGTVHVAASEITGAERWIECAVADEGPGFREADLPSVFKPFFTRRRGGTGLGLSIVARIVDEHGGIVWASNRPNGGGLITVRLPVR